MTRKLLKFPAKKETLEETYIDAWLPLEATKGNGYKLVEDTDRIFKFGCWVWVRLGDIALRGHHTLFTPLGYIIRFIDRQADGHILVRAGLPDERDVLYRPEQIQIEGRVVEVLDDPEDPFCERWVLTRRKASKENLYLRSAHTIKG